ncbi:MAG: DEAD/DEAH box helicase [Candidatus Riflebacteria bacterium]|nr:DEAD/DEAH box helicase [Candidatus Riflebacteria bacterium]
MGEINPLRFASSVQDTFRRYLFTAHPICDSEPALRDAFWRELCEEYPLSSGPYLHCVPTYAPGNTILELIARQQPPSLHPKFARLPRAAFDPDRRLYKHQTDAIAGLQNGRNLLVASGTGSGKTECFLLPILDAILREPGPGVRAVIVYPLNALANDQLERLRSLLGGFPEVTFGRYTGETPWSEKDARDVDCSRCPKNERYVRTQLRDDPPNILLIHAEGTRRKQAVERNRIVDYLSCLSGLGLDHEADRQELAAWMDALWDILIDGVLERHGPAGCYSIPPERLLCSTAMGWFRCSRCTRMTNVSAQGVCAAWRCPGELTAVDPQALAARLRDDHNGQRYRQPPLPVVVREHTAQLMPDIGREYQESFVAGRINVLSSSSTTFEMGVDVGQLKAVLLRNVPPTPASYIQRAGRAGRRQDGASYSVTYCRNVPHDQFHFSSPLEAIAGRVPVPRINLGNPKLAQRQVNSFLLGSFLRSLPADDKHDHLNIADFFASDRVEASPMHEHYAVWNRENEQALASDVRRILPREAELRPEDAVRRSAELLCNGPDSIAQREFLEEVTAYGKRLESLRQRALDSPVAEMCKYSNAAAVLSRLREDFLKERLINFLSRTGWLPGYSFPQDTVTLRVAKDLGKNRRLRLNRDREYGIAEYAPGAEVIADGKLYRSQGLHKKGRDFEFRYYKYCSGCRRLSTGAEKAKLAGKCPCNQDLARHEAPRPYVRPEGFSTHVQDEAAEPDFVRLRPPPVTDIFLLSGCLPEEFSEHPGIPGLTFGTTAEGKLFRANAGFKGKGFSFCGSCGAQEPERKSAKASTEHVTLWGDRCAGKFYRADLAHEFTTDLLQLRFDRVVAPVPPVYERAFWLSLVTSLLTAAATSLSIDRLDLDGTYQGQRVGEGSAEIILYDRVPGGAGYVQLLVERLPQVLQATRELLHSCPCDLEASCYRCMRSARNQFSWAELKRRPVLEWLDRLLG